MPVKTGTHKSVVKDIRPTKKYYFYLWNTTENWG